MENRLGFGFAHGGEERLEASAAKDERVGGDQRPLYERAEEAQLREDLECAGAVALVEALAWVRVRVRVLRGVRERVGVRVRVRLPSSARSEKATLERATMARPAVVGLEGPNAEHAQLG